MKNYEKYAKEIKNYENNRFCVDFIRPKILKRDDCNGVSCNHCNLLASLWLLEEYEEPEVDWSKVAVDTPVFVRNTERETWRRRNFAKFEKGKVYAWWNGRTSWTVNNSDCMNNWKYAKLAE